MILSPRSAAVRPRSQVEGGSALRARKPPQSRRADARAYLSPIDNMYSLPSEEIGESKRDKIGEIPSLIIRNAGEFFFSNYPIEVGSGDRLQWRRDSARILSFLARVFEVYIFFDEHPVSPANGADSPLALFEAAGARHIVPRRRWIVRTRTAGRDINQDLKAFINMRIDCVVGVYDYSNLYPSNIVGACPAPLRDREDALELAASNLLQKLKARYLNVINAEIAEADKTIDFVENVKISLESGGSTAMRAYKNVLKSLEKHYENKNRLERVKVALLDGNEQNKIQPMPETYTIYKGKNVQTYKY